MDRRQNVFIALFVIIILILAGGLYAANVNFARHIPGGEGLLIPWMGARGFFTDKSDPYSIKIADATQILIYGHPAGGGEYPFRYFDPFYVLILFFPLASIRDYSVVRGLWLVISEVALITLLLINIKLTEWRLFRSTLVLYFLFGLFGFFSLFSLVQGSGAIIFALLFAAILLSLRRGMDEVAGGLLALIAYRWEISGLFITCVFIWILSQRRWRVLVMFLMVLTVLLVVATIIFPSWPLPFIRAVITNFHNYRGWNPGEAFKELWPAIGHQLGWILTVTLFGILVLEWRAMRGTIFQRFLWVTCLTLTATPLTGIPTNPANLPIILIPMTLLFSIIEERWAVNGRYYVAIVLFLLSGLWVALLRVDVSGSKYIETIIMLPFPIFLLISLYWVRWWGIRPPKTWTDQIHESNKR